MTTKRESDYATTTGGRKYWNRRNSRGQFCTARGLNSEDTLRDEYEAYVLAEVELAESATNGNMLSERGRTRWISVEDVMTGRRALSGASAELRDHLAERGLILGFRMYVHHRG